MDSKTKHGWAGGEVTAGREGPCGASGRRSGPRCKGSAVVLVVVAMSLMAVMGAVYLQSVQKEVKSTRDLRNEQYADMVVDAVIGQIAQVLKDDLMDDGGNFFTQADNDEAYDYPWTNPSVTHAVVGKSGGSLMVQGGAFDDMWLASSAPDFSGQAKWPHLTNLNGIYLIADAQGRPVLDPVDQLPQEEAVDGGEDSDVALDNTLVDADGDGIGDSRWTWAPVKDVGGEKFIMAVRIIDNSAMVNVNTAMSQLQYIAGSDSFAYGTTAQDAPHWLNPAELDLGRFVYELSTTDRNTTMGELLNVLQYRTKNTGLTLPVPVADRLAFWENGPSANHESTAYNTLRIGDELELRHRNGLNNSLNTSLIESEDINDDVSNDQPGFHAFARQALTDSEQDYTDLGTVQEYFEAEPRHQMTAFSGGVSFVPLANSDGKNLKLPLNHVQDGGSLSFSQASAAMVYEELEHLLVNSGTFGGTKQDYAEQIVTNMLDYADGDNIISIRDLDENGTPHYGLEALPFLTEVYAQTLYQAAGSVDNGGGSWTVTWNRVGETGYALEIRNPFNRSISLQNVKVFVNGADWGNLTDLAPKTWLAPWEVMIIFRNSQDSALGDNGIQGLGWTTTGSGHNSLPSDPAVIDGLTTAHSWPTVSGTINVELRCKAVNESTTTWVTYSRFQCRGMPDAHTTTGGAAVADGSQDYLQYAWIGNSVGWYTMAVQAASVNEEGPIGPDGTGPSRDTTIDGLGTADKGLKNASGGAQLPLTQQVTISDRGYFLYTGELAHLLLLGVDPSQPFAEKWNLTGTTDLKTRMLDFAATDMVGQHDLAVPQAVMVLNQFTTVPKHAQSAVDGNGDGTFDTIIEGFVPGTINLNTAPRHLLDEILPIPDEVVLDAVLDAIELYRDDPTSRPAVPFRQERGIAGVGELMVCLKNVLMDSQDNATLTESVFGSNVVPVDFESEWDDDAAKVIEKARADTVQDDREEEAMIAKWLMQTCSTRSDIFTAYVLIQGYKPKDNGSYDYTTPDEAARFFVVFDRSAIVDADDSVRVLGVYRYR